MTYFKYLSFTMLLLAQSVCWGSDLLELTFPKREDTPRPDNYDLLRLYIRKNATIVGTDENGRMILDSKRNPVPSPEGDSSSSILGEGRQTINPDKNGHTFTESGINTDYYRYLACLEKNQWTQLGSNPTASSASNHEPKSLLQRLIGNAFDSPDNFDKQKLEAMRLPASEWRISNLSYSPIFGSQTITPTGALPDSSSDKPRIYSPEDKDEVRQRAKGRSFSAAA